MLPRKGQKHVDGVCETIQALDLEIDIIHWAREKGIIIREKCRQERELDRQGLTTLKIEDGLGWENVHAFLLARPDAPSANARRWINDAGNMLCRTQQVARMISSSIGFDPPC